MVHEINVSLSDEMYKHLELRKKKFGIPISSQIKECISKAILEN